jgi:hypothetical protein
MSKKFFSILVLSAVICSVGGISTAQAEMVRCKSAPTASKSTDCPRNCRWTCMAKDVKPGCGCEEHPLGAVPAPGLILVPLQAPR